jgi:hypothetical protein
MKLQRLRCGMELKFASDEAKVGTFSGYGSVFNLIDAGGDLIAPGAFKQTLKDWKGKGGLPKMLLQHGGFFGPAEDGIPIGKYTSMEEDTKGLYLEGELFALNTQKGQYIYEGLKSGALDGLSIGYQAVDVTFGKKPDEPRRTIKKINLFEISVVTYPMNSESRIDAAKSIESIKSLSDAEDYLRDACGFSRSQSVAFVSRIKSLRPSDSERLTDEQMNALVESFPTILR